MPPQRHSSRRQDEVFGRRIRYCLDCNRVFVVNENNINHKGFCGDCQWTRDKNSTRRVTITIPRSDRKCVLCRFFFPSRSFANPADENSPLDRCLNCRKCERCSTCSKVKKNRHFKKPSNLGGFYKTCADCRTKDASRYNRLREKARNDGMSFCVFGKHPVPAESLIDAAGIQRMSCRDCLERRRLARQQQVHPPEEEDFLDDEHVDGPLEDEGVEAVQMDEFDALLEDMEDVPFDLPDDASVEEHHASYLKKFREAIAKVTLDRCEGCHEQGWQMKLSGGRCNRCRLDTKAEVPKWSQANLTMPDIEVPPCLKGLTDIEEQMISRVHTMMQVRHTKGRQLSYKEHIVNFSKDIQSIATSLPRLPEDLDQVIIRREDVDMSGHIDFVVRREKVRGALEWKMANDPSYSDLTIDQHALSQLPLQGSVVHRIPFVLDTSPVVDDAPSGPGEASSNADQPEDPLNNVQVQGVLNIEPRGGQGRQEMEAVRAGVRSVLRGSIRYEQEHIIRAPDIDTTPLSETTPGYMPRAFPSLFPTGAGDLHQARIRKVEHGEYFTHLLRFHDGRFSRHRRFPWFAFNTLQRMRAFGSAKVFVRQNHEASRLTAEEIRVLLEEGDTTLANKMIRFGGTLRGTRAYWLQRRQELMDMIKVVGTPHLFFTLSAADLQWPDLHRHMPEETPHNAADDASLRRQRRLALQRNPHLAASYLDIRLQLFQKLVLNPLFDIKHFWYRYEWQERGSGHIHGFFWIEDAPNVEKINWEALKSNDVILSDEQDGLIKEFIAFWDRLIVATNPFPLVDENAPLRGQHPSNKEFASLKDTKEELSELLNWVERHTKCKEGYCKVKRKQQGQEIIVCRFDYPFQTADHAGVGFDSKRRIRFEPWRNDPNLNAYNPTVILGWRANIDLKPVMSKDAAIQYVAKYATKAEQQAPSFPNMLSDLVSNMNGDTPARTACQRLLNKMIAERSYSAQETSHLLNGIPLVRSSVSFATLNLAEGGSLREVRLPETDATGDQLMEEPDAADGGRHVTGRSWVQRYIDRPPDMENLSMQDVLIGYTWYSNTWRQRKDSSSPVILRVFPRLSPDPSHALHDEYCRVKVMLHHPFRSTDDLRDLDDENERKPWSMVFADCKVIHELGHSRDTLREWEEEMNRVVEDDEDDEETVNPEVADMTEEDWQLYSRLHPGAQLPVFENIDIGKRPLDAGWDTEAARSRWDDVERMGSFLDEERKLANDGLGVANGADEEQVDIETLSLEQRAIFDTYVNVYSRILDGEVVEPMYMNIDGTAGCGKTYLIRAVCQKLRSMATEREARDPIRVVAPSGVAALNIQGRTCHSAFCIPANGSAFRELAGSRLATLQNDFEGVKFIIIDEKSMLGQRMLARLDSRMRQIQANTSAFGGFHICLIGDFGQLPPVGDRCLFAPACRNGGELSQLSCEGAHLYQTLFTQNSYRLRTVYRQQGADQEPFRQLLYRASKGGMTVADWELLCTREESKLSHAERSRFTDAICLFTKCEEVEGFNLNSLVELNQPCARIQAHNGGGHQARTAGSDEAMGLENEVVLSMGAKVMISKNLWQQEGLVNGTTGTVQDVIWAPGASRSDLPCAVLVACPTYTGPTLWRTNPCPGFPVGIPLVPIPPVKATFDINGKRFSRTQLPLRLAWAVTVHKSQGLTLLQARIGLGKSEFTSGLTFVALSRVKTLQGLTLVDRVDYTRVRNLGGRGMQERLGDFARRYRADIGE